MLHPPASCAPTCLPPPLAGEPVHVAAMGASVTRGSGSCDVQAADTRWPGYVTQFEMWLNSTFPGARVRVSNTAVPGAGVEMLAACLNSMVPQVGLGGQHALTKLQLRWCCRLQGRRPRRLHGRNMLWPDRPPGDQPAC